MCSGEQEQSFLRDSRSPQRERERKRERESAGGCEQIDWPFQEFCDSVASEKWIMQCLSLNSQLVNIAHGRNATYLPEVSQTLLPTLPTYSDTQNLFTAPSAAAL